MTEVCWFRLLQHGACLHQVCENMTQPIIHDHQHSHFGRKPVAAYFVLNVTFSIAEVVLIV